MKRLLACLALVCLPDSMRAQGVTGNPTLGGSLTYSALSIPNCISPTAIHVIWFLFSTGLAPSPWVFPGVGTLFLEPSATFIAPPDTVVPYQGPYSPCFSCYWAYKTVNIPPNPIFIGTTIYAQYWLEMFNCGQRISGYVASTIT